MLYHLLFAKKEKKKRNWGLFPGQICPSSCATLEFTQWFGAIKNCVKGQSLNFMCTLCVHGFLVG
jgi:hypothetical protein